MPALELFPLAVPPPSKVFVKRDAQPEKFGLYIHVPEHYRTAKVSATGTIAAVGENLDPELLGAKVILASSAGRKLVFGDHDEETIYVCPTSVLMAVVVSPDVAVHLQGQRSPQGRYPLSDREPEAEDGVLL